MRFFIFSWVCLFVILIIGFFLEGSLTYKLLGSVFFVLIFILNFYFFFASDNNDKESDSEFSEQQEDINLIKEIPAIESIELDSKGRSEYETTDEDISFKKAVNGLIKLSKEFYSSENSAIYWYNNIRKNFKLLSATDNKIFKELFYSGNDLFSVICSEGKSRIIKVAEPDYDRTLLKFYHDNSMVRSIMLSPLHLDDEVIGVLICDSNIENYFGDPDLDTFSIFARMITDQIGYYSVKEEYDFERYMMGCSFDKFKYDDSYYFELIYRVVNRFINSKATAILTFNDGILKMRNSNLAKEVEYYYPAGNYIEEKSIAYQSIVTGKFLICDFSDNNKLEYRFNKKDRINLSSRFCSLPIIISGRKIGVITFETNENNSKVKNVVGSIYRLAASALSSLYMMKYHRNVFDYDLRIYNREFFEMRLSKEIGKCRSMNDNCFVCIYTGFDNFDTLSEVIDNNRLESLLVMELRSQLNEYDMIFRLDHNQYAILTGFKDDDLAFIEFERIRKEISIKIFTLDNTEFTTSVSFAIKRYNNFDNDPETYKDEIDKILKLAMNEGGNITKIY